MSWCLLKMYDDGVYYSMVLAKTEVSCEEVAEKVETFGNDKFAEMEYILEELQKAGFIKEYYDLGPVSDDEASLDKVLMDVVEKKVSPYMDAAKKRVQEVLEKLENLEEFSIPFDDKESMIMWLIDDGNLPGDVKKEIGEIFGAEITRVDLP